MYLITHNIFGIIRFVLYPEAVVWRCSLKTVFKNFAKFTSSKFTRKHLCWCLFLSAASNFIKIKIQHRCFPVNFCKFSKNIPFNWPHLMTTSSSQKMQNIKIHLDSYMQWPLCLMVSMASEATGFYLTSLLKNINVNKPIYKIFFLWNSTTTIDP